LCRSLIHQEPQSAFAILTLVEVAAILSKHLPEGERASIVWHLNECAEELKARWQ
jgi:hypothetical protein